MSSNLTNPQFILMKMQALGQKFGFGIETTEKEIGLFAKDTSGATVKWIWYKKDACAVQWLGSTDYCNLWFCDTRKDLTPERLISFVDDLNTIFESHFTVSHLIDPDDWQELANVRNAYHDPRYCTSMAS